MRKLLILFAMLQYMPMAFNAGTAPTPPTFVQSCNTGIAGEATTCALSGVTAGDALYTTQYNGGGSALSLTTTDSQSNTYTIPSFTAHTAQGLASDGDTIAVTCAIAGSSGSDTVTFKSSGVASPVFGAVYEVSNSSCGIDVAVSSNALTATSCNSGPLTTTVANDFLIGACGLGTPQGPFAAGSGWSHGLNGGGNSSDLDLLSEIQIATSTGSYTATSGALTSTEQATIEVAFIP